MDQLRADCAALEAQLAAQKSGEKVFEERHAADTDRVATMMTEIAELQDKIVIQAGELEFIEDFTIGTPTDALPTPKDGWTQTHKVVEGARRVSCQLLAQVQAERDEAIANRDRCHEANKILSKELAELSEAGVAVADAKVEISNVRAEIREIRAKMERLQNERNLAQSEALFRRELSRHPQKLTLAERLTGRTARISLAGPVDASVAGNVPPEPREPNLNPDVPIALPSDRDIHD